MNFATGIIKNFSKRAREKRAEIFRKSFVIDETTKILDLGSEDGSNINSVLQETKADPKNVFIADIDPKVVKKGAELYKFNPVVIDESGSLPFSDGFFDIVYCSSVIEHVTIPKEKIWEIQSDEEFSRLSKQRQKIFADEIKRLGKQYYVQTPYKYFFIESHTWLPFISFLPRIILLPILKMTNLFWIKRTNPDWCLFNKKDFSEMFNEAVILEEKCLGFTKSLMAVSKKSN